MPLLPVFPFLPVSATQSSAKTFQLRLRYCDFCQQETFHACQLEEKDTHVGPYPYVASKGVLLQCSGCQAYTVG